MSRSARNQSSANVGTSNTFDWYANHSDVGMPPISGYEAIQLRRMENSSVNEVQFSYG